MNQKNKEIYECVIGRWQFRWTQCGTGLGRNQQVSVSLRQRNPRNAPHTSRTAFHLMALNRMNFAGIGRDQLKPYKTLSFKLI